MLRVTVTPALVAVVATVRVTAVAESIDAIRVFAANPVPVRSWPTTSPVVLEMLSSVVFVCVSPVKVKAPVTASLEVFHAVLSEDEIKRVGAAETNVSVIPVATPVIAPRLALVVP
jgi:hypothetical protein